MTGRLKLSYRRPGCWILLILVVSLLELPTTQANTLADMKSKSRRLNEPVVIKKGESLPNYRRSIDPEESSFIDGVRTLGEWMKMAGVLADEEAIIETAKDPYDIFELDFGTEDQEEDQYMVLRRDDTSTEAPTVAPVPNYASVACSKRGLLLNKTGLVDKCQGYKCHITSMVCDGVLYSEGSLYSYIGSMDHCEVLSISCPNHFEENHIFPNACPIQKFLCPVNDTKLPSELGGQSFAPCQVQVYCPSEGGSKNTFYGWEAFDYECTNQRLVCDGVVVEDPNGYRSENGTCVIEHIPCESVGSTTTATCSRIESTCQTLPSATACQSRVDHSVECETGIPRQYATIEEITCGGETHLYPTWTGSIAGCTSVRSIRQFGSVITLPYDAAANSYCVLTELDCGGVRTVWNFTERVPEGCGIATVVCGNTPPFPPTTWPPAQPTCETHDFGCRMGHTICTYGAIDFPCAGQCRQPGLTPQCDCPVDWKGEKCESPREIRCDFNITESRIRLAHGQVETYAWNKDCRKNLPKRQLGEPICHPVKNEDELFIHGLLNCSFVDGPVDVLLATVVTDFNYTVIAENFRLSNVTFSKRWDLAMKLINFNSFTDFEATPIITLTHSQMVGNDTVDFVIKPTVLDDRFKQGGRITAEWQFLGPSFSPFNWNGHVMTAATIDIMDWSQNYPKASSRVNLRILSLVLLILFALFIAALFVWRYYKKKRQEAQSHPQ